MKYAFWHVDREFSNSVGWFTSWQGAWQLGSAEPLCCLFVRVFLIVLRKFHGSIVNSANHSPTHAPTPHPNHTFRFRFKGIPEELPLKRGLTRSVSPMCVALSGIFKSVGSRNDVLEPLAIGRHRFNVRATPQNCVDRCFKSHFLDSVFKFSKIVPTRHSTFVEHCILNHIHTNIFSNVLFNFKSNTHESGHLNMSKMGNLKIRANKRQHVIGIRLVGFRTFH